MFGAQPPRRLSIVSTRKLRLTLFMCSGRKCAVNFPGNDISESWAFDPVTTMLIGAVYLAAPAARPEPVEGRAERSWFDGLTMSGWCNLFHVLADERRELLLGLLGHELRLGDDGGPERVL